MKNEASTLQPARTAEHGRRVAFGGATPAPTQSMPGRGWLCVERVGAKSVVTGARASSPLRLLTPANHGHAAWVYTSTYGGGLVDGDVLELEIDIGPEATAFLSTQASTKVYRSPRGSRSVMRAAVASGALLVSWPDPVVPFAGARYRQTQLVDVQAGGGLILVDALASGRHASGERWAFDEYSSRMEVRHGGRTLVYDPLRLYASDGTLATRMGRFNAWATVIVAGEPLAREAMLIAERTVTAPVAAGADRLMTAVPLGDAACLVRVASTSGEEAARTIRSLLACVPERLGDDPWQRKW